MEEIIVKLDGKEHKVKIEESNGKVKVHFEGKSYDVETQSAIEKEVMEGIASKKADSSGNNIVKAPLPGTVVAINVKIGSKVQELVAMKMENDIIAEKNGIVKEIKVKKNDSVNKDDILVILD
jgi:biotin carboxyl carrier protein